MTVHTDLNDQVILVTGASRGLGRHLCRHFAGLGMRVAAVARTEGELLELKSEVEKDGGIVMPFPASVYVKTRDGKPSDSSSFMKSSEMAELIELILRAPSGTLFKEVILFPIGEAESW